jgi:hypothetical protein
MNESRKSETDPQLEERDKLLGRAIARALENGGCATSCPSPEAMAALVDGRARDDERDILLRHLAECGRCRQVFITARELMQDEAAVGNRKWYTIPSVLAAAAVLIIALTIALRPSPPETVQMKRSAETANLLAEPQKGLPQAVKRETASVARKEPPLLTADQLARQLAQASDPRQLAALTGTRGKNYGFAGNKDDTALSFRVGVSAMDLEIALLADDSDRAQAEAVRLGALLQALTGDDSAADLEQLVEKLERGEKPSRYVSRSVKIERALSHDKVVYARLGVWAEGARLAARTGNGEFFAGGVPTYFRKSINSMGASRRAANALRDLDKKMKDPQKIDFRSVESELEELIREF